MTTGVPTSSARRITARLNRRSAVRATVAGAAAAAVAARGSARSVAQEATPEAAEGECVATAPPTQDGVGFAPLLVGGIVPDMPPGPVEVRISRFTLEPGAGVPPGAMPYPSLMYIETGASTCPGNPGKVLYAADGRVLAETSGGPPHVCPTGTTWYIPAGVEDAADNDGGALMSSLVIEFIPVEGGMSGTPTG